MRSKFYTTIWQWQSILIYAIIIKNNSFLRPAPEKTYLIGESAFRLCAGGEQHG